jgi:hypothetical protein
MADGMLSDMLLDLNMRRLLADSNQIAVGDSSGSWFYRPTGWAIPDDTDHGVSWGGGEVEIGGGIMQMDLRDCRPPPGQQPLYSLWGPYAEVGIPIKGVSFGQDFVKRLQQLLRLGKKQPGSDLYVLPGGSFGQFVYGPANVLRLPLEIGDFRMASWLYLYFGLEVFVGAGDVGLMFMIDGSSFKLDTFASLLTANIGGAIGSLMVNCKAWAPYYGVSATLGAGGKVALRYVQTVYMKTTSSAVPILAAA